MTLDDAKVQELRQLFRQGATPAMLIRHMIRRDGGAVNAAEMRRHLEAAFCLPLARLVRADVDYFADVGYCVAINRRLLPEIMEHRQEWDRGEQDGPQTNWYAGLVVTPPEEARAAADEMAHPWLSARSWANLSAQEQDSLRLEMASARVMHERFKVFAALVEQLQRQVEHLEQQREGETAASGRG